MAILQEKFGSKKKKEGEEEETKDVENKTVLHSEYAYSTSVLPMVSRHTAVCHTTQEAGVSMVSGKTMYGF